MVTGVIQAGASLGILVPPSVVLVLYAMIARQPVGQLWLAGGDAGADDGGAVHPLHRDPLPHASRPSAPRCRRGRTPGCRRAEKLRLLRAGSAAIGHLRGHDGAVRERLDQRSWKAAAVGALTGCVSGGRPEGPDDAGGVRDLGPSAPSAISCMFMWIILAALGFGAVFDGLGGGAMRDRGSVHRPPRPKSVDDPDSDATELHSDGHVP